ncbi:MAG: hypothetical protein R8K48_05230 [Gallionella sp.]
MAISSVSIHQPTSLPIQPAASNTNAPFTTNAKLTPVAPPSSVVTLSAQAHKLNQSPANVRNNTSQSYYNQLNNQANATTRQNVPLVPKAANEAPGIQFIQGDPKGGRISTYA